MKKILVMMLVLAMTLSFVACGKKDKDVTADSTPTDTTVSSVNENIDDTAVSEQKEDLSNLVEAPSSVNNPVTSSTNPTNDITDNYSSVSDKVVNSVPVNNNTNQEMPPEDNATNKLFDNVTEVKNWLKSSEAKNTTNLKGAVTFFSEKGLIVPTAPVGIKNIGVYSNSMTFFFNDNINNVRLNNIQVFRLVNNQLDYVDKGIFKYFSDYLKKPLDKEVVFDKEDGETESIWYNTTNVSINGKTVECVKITTNREDPEEVYHIIYGNCRISFSVEPVDKAGKVDTSSVLKQIQLETVPVK